MTKVKNSPGKIRYDLYLDKESDAALIEYLDTFKKANRMNIEMRRMLFAALNGSIDAATIIQTRAPQPGRAAPSQPTVYATGNTAGVSAAAPKDDILSKLKRSFSSMED